MHPSGTIVSCAMNGVWGLCISLAGADSGLAEWITLPGLECEVIGDVLEGGPRGASFAYEHSYP